MSKPPSETQLLRKKVRELHAAKPFSVSILREAGIDPDNTARDLNCPRKAVCQWLIDNHGAETATSSPPAEVSPLAPFGAFGDAIAAAIESAIDSIPAPSVPEDVIDRCVDKAYSTAIKSMPPAPVIDETTIEGIIRRMLSALPKVERVSIAARSIASDDDQPNNIKILARFCAPGAAKKPVKFAGEPGASKTWAARRWGSMFGEANVFDISCHAGTSQREILGAYVPFGSGFTRVYGKLARAWRNAANGTPTLVIVDEINRLPVELNSFFCGGLNKQVRGGVESYVLDTGLPDGEGGTEEIACPCHMLSVVSTCNEGAGYHVSTDDRAEMQRWLHCRVSFSETEVRKIIATILFDKFETTATTLTDSLVTFLVASREMALVQRRLQTPPTIRCVVDAAHVADKLEDVPAVLWLLATGWYCGLDRTTNAPEKSHIDTLKALFAASGLTCPA